MPFPCWEHMEHWSCLLENQEGWRGEIPCKLICAVAPRAVKKWLLLRIQSRRDRLPGRLSRAGCPGDPAVPALDDPSPEQQWHHLSSRVVRPWHRLAREGVDTPFLGNIHSQVGQGLELPGLVEGGLELVDLQRPFQPKQSVIHDQDPALEGGMDRFWMC